MKYRITWHDSNDEAPEDTLHTSRNLYNTREEAVEAAKELQEHHNITDVNITPERPRARPTRTARFGTRPASSKVSPIGYWRGIREYKLIANGTPRYGSAGYWVKYYFLPDGTIRGGWLPLRSTSSSPLK